MTCERRTVVIDDQFCCAAQQRSTTSAPSPARRRAPGTSATAAQDWRVKETRRDCLFSSAECAPEDRLISMSEYRLAHEIIALSRARTWAEAKLEWEILEVYEVKAPEACLCGHRPIVELCVLINKVNGQRATVGNHCVKQFLGLPSGQIFEALKRIEKDPTRSLNKEAIEYLFRKGLITSWEKKFCANTMRKRNLSSSQIETKIKINEDIIRKIRRRSPSRP